MDGYSLTEKIRKVRRKFRLTATEQALFYELVAICNCYGWEDRFECSNMELCFALSINEKTLVRSRQSLIDSGLIFYQSGKSKRAVSSYSFNKPFTKQTTVKNTVVVTANAGGDVTANVSTNGTDYLKHKTKTKLIPPLSPKGNRGEEDEEVSLNYYLSFTLPDDGVNRNYKGLVDNLIKRRFSKKEINQIILFSNYGEIGGEIWKLFKESDKQGIKLPKQFILSRIKK